MTPEPEGEDMTTVTDERPTERAEQHLEGGDDRPARDATATPRAVDGERSNHRDDPGSASSGPPRWLLLALLVWGVAMLGIAAWSFLRADGLADERDDRRAAASVAGEFASATMSYDHRDLDGSLAAVTDLATTEYAETYQNAFFEELQPVVDELRARGRVHVRDVYVSDVSDGTATAVVSFDAVIRSTIGTRRLAGSYVRVDLVEEGGAWRADDLTFLATTQEGLDGPTGAAGATTPTTAPAG
ncbi:MAG: hypothetical protein JNK12_00030 [Acidimicrobiales bacterium]|nr:hypothetical protein [Acidimicrobiales bacterium]